MHFVSYQVRMNGHEKWGCVSPADVFEEVDRVFWQAVGAEMAREKRASERPHADAPVLEVRGNGLIADVTAMPYTPAEERCRFWQSYSLNTLARNNDWEQPVLQRIMERTLRSCARHHPGSRKATRQEVQGQAATNILRLQDEPSFSDLWEEVARFAGRQLLWTEVRHHWSLDFRGKDTCMLQLAYLFGAFDWLSAIAPGDDGQESGRTNVRDGWHESGRTNVRDRWHESGYAYCRRCGYLQEQQMTSRATPRPLDRSSNRRGANQARQRAAHGGHEHGPHVIEAIWKRLVNRWLTDHETLIPAPCSRCGSADCYYCPQCLQMGRATSCEPLLRWSPSLPTASRSFPDGKHGQPSAQKADEHFPGDVPFRWQGTLSAAQQRASDFLADVVHHEQGESTSPPRRCLLWAVCGAGKTEVWLETIRIALANGEKVLIAAPRRDVVLELSPRLRHVFPATTIRTLHGESTEKYTSGDVFISTTHQTLRFYRFFDLAIIDEEDAFPYDGDPLLQFAVQRALAPNGRIIYSTATPSRSLRRQMRRGTLPTTIIPGRYHGHPLAVPVIQRVGNWRQHMQQGMIITEMVAFLVRMIQNERYAYWFVPHVSDLELVLRYVYDQLLPYMARHGRIGTDSGRASFAVEPISVQTVHANDRHRTEIVDQFRKQRIRLLITTTILERGVTIPYCDVAVLGSDDAVFDDAALIQMAGRTGRKIDDPTGSVYFWPEERTRSQLACIDQITRWNQMKMEP